jgi:hypothetical protein
MRSLLLFGYYSFASLPVARKLLKHALPVVMHVDEYVGHCIQTQGVRVYAHKDAPQAYAFGTTIGHNLARENYMALGIGLLVLVVLCIAIVAGWRCLKCQATAQ